MKQHGFNLIEMMIAMVLGLFIIAGVVNIFQSNSHTFQSNQALSQIQTSMRSSFEILSRDLRHTGFTPCGNRNKVANILNISPNPLYEWVGIRGADGNDNLEPLTTGSQVGERVSGTSAILVQGIQGQSRALAMHDTAAAIFTLAPLANSVSFKSGDILMACDYRQASIFQVSAVYGEQLHYHPNVGVPGNCTTGLGLSQRCAATPAYIAYGPNSTIARFMSTIWYIGHNGRPEDGNRSLFRLRLGEQGDIVTEEMVTGISHMDITYHRENQTIWESASQINSTNAWDQVDALRLVMTLHSLDTLPATDQPSGSQRLQRTFTQVIALRNRTL